MKNTLLVALFALMSISAFANDGDLTIPGERWLARHAGYVCAAFEPDTNTPVVYADMNLQFESLTTDHSLDNGLIKATFEVEGQVCRYSAILLADNAAATIDLVESKAYAVEGNVDCSAGKEIVDANLLANDYLYYGHPHNLAIMAPFAGAAEVCGEGATHVGIRFVVAGRIQ